MATGADLITDQDYPSNAATRESVDVECIAVNGFMSEEAIDHIDILKLDTPERETRILRDAEKTLSESKISLVFTGVNIVRLYRGGELYRQVAGELYQFELCYTDCMSLNWPTMVSLYLATRSFSLHHWEMSDSRKFKTV